MMETLKTPIHASSRTLLADLQTPVSIYLKVRDMFPHSVLLESSDYHSADNSYSFIGIEPIARFSVRAGQLTEQFPDGRVRLRQLGPELGVQDALNDFVASFQVSGDTAVANGFFGYTAYDAVRYFEPVEIASPDEEMSGIPEITYMLYRFVIAVNHLRGEMTVTENLSPGEPSKLDQLLSIDSRNFPTYDFRARGGVTSPVTDEQYMEMVRSGIAHCLRGDVFQIVLSRRFQQPYIGDDFKVYRALRSINPSPYLFYFDFGSYRIFGS